MDDEQLEKEFKNIGESIDKGLKTHREQMLEALKTAREDTSREIGTVRTEVGKIGDAFNKHLVDAGRKEEQIDSRARSAHYRIEETNDRINKIEDKKDTAKRDHRGMIWAFWGVIVTAVITGVFALIVAFVSPDENDESQIIGPAVPIVAE